MLTADPDLRGLSERELAALFQFWVREGRPPGLYRIASIYIRRGAKNRVSWKLARAYGDYGGIIAGPVKPW